MKCNKWVVAIRGTRVLPKLPGRAGCLGRDRGERGALPWQRLVSHPASPGPKTWRLRARLAWARDGALRLDYQIRAPRGALSLPPRTNPGRQDGLWRHSCCEAFIGLPGETAYREFNFSPSGAWALYDFADERVPLPQPQVEGEGDAPGVRCERRLHAWRLRARIPPDLLPKRQPGAALLLGLAAVVEDRQGGLTYWALGHPRPQPDFHHPGGRLLTLSGPGRDIPIRR
jgi:hypothetical protein